MSSGDALGSRGCCCAVLCQLLLQGLGCERPLFWELWRAQDKLSASPALCFLTKCYLLQVLGVGLLCWLSAVGKLFMVGMGIPTKNHLHFWARHAMSSPRKQSVTTARFPEVKQSPVPSGG